MRNRESQNGKNSYLKNYIRTFGLIFCLFNKILNAQQQSDALADNMKKMTERWFFKIFGLPPKNFTLPLKKRILILCRNTYKLLPFYRILKTPKSVWSPLWIFFQNIFF